MNRTHLLEKEESLASEETPFLSHSRISKYLFCPEQYRLYYVERLRLRVPAANLVFGQLTHQALALLFRHEGDPVAFFQEAWKEAGQTELTYSQRDTWEKLRDAGNRLLEKFLEEELGKLGEIQAIEKPFELRITSLNLPLVGVIDLVADLEGTPSVVDFKTSGSSYGDYEVTLSDQLLAYSLAEPDALQAAYCVLVKTKKPWIEWQTRQQRGAELGEYLRKAEVIGRFISEGVFYKRPGKWCSYCDYLPACMGDSRKTEEKLVRIPPYNRS